MTLNSTVVTPPSAEEAVLRYQAIRDRLPAAEFPSTSIYKPNLEALCDDIDCFVLDGFGVLNVGDSTVPGAVDRVRALRALGKEVRVLTNGASYPVAKTRGKYMNWGMPFSAEEVVSSRDALAVALAGLSSNKCWGFSALARSELDELTPNAALLENDYELYKRCDGFVLLGAGEWTDEKQQLLIKALQDRPRPLLVGNPDLVAPQTAGLSKEPGWYAHLIQDATGVEPKFYGKPFDNAFSLIRKGVDGIDPSRIAMVGDTLHTDILGGAQSGWKTVLVTDHGLMRGLDVEVAIQDSGIRPDYVVPTT